MQFLGKFLTILLCCGWLLSALSCESDHEIVGRNFSGWIPSGAEFKVLVFNPDFSFYVLKYKDPKPGGVWTSLDILADKLQHGYSIDIRTSNTIAGSKETSRSQELVYYGTGDPGYVLFAYFDVDSPVEAAMAKRYFAKVWPAYNKPSLRCGGN